MGLVLFVNETLNTYFAFLGFAYTCHFMLAGIKNLIHYIRNGSFIYTTKEREIFSLSEKLSLTLQDKAKLETQLQEITQHMIKRLQEKQ